MVKIKRSQSGKNHAWIIPIILLAVLTLSVGGYYAWSRLDWLQDEPGPTTSMTTTMPTTTEDPELVRMRAELDQDVFYQGIWINGVDVSGYGYDVAFVYFENQQTALMEQTVITLHNENGETWSLTGMDIGLESDWAEVINKAWQVGRVLDRDMDDEAAIRTRYATIQALKKEPLKLNFTYDWDENQIQESLEAIADEVAIEPKGAYATGFDLSQKQFIIAEREPGAVMNLEASLGSIRQALENEGIFSRVPIAMDAITSGMTASELGANLGKVSEGRTYAYANNPPRDENIRLICKMLNGLVLQPGETFSFNGYIGERTAAKGFQEAGGIRDGVLIQELGGGICQPNTTLCHAVVKADLEIVERHPHSWPSSYAPIGLDATVTWGGADFKFKNSTEYPVAIVAWYSKPAIVVQIYGRLLEPGVSISLTSRHDGYLDIKDPIEEFDETLEPGEVVVEREEHVGQLATAFKVWSKDGKVIKREVLFTSRYRSIQGIIKYGPEPTPTPEPTEPTTEEPTTESETTTSTTSATTTASETTTQEPTTETPASTPEPTPEAGE